MKILNTKYRKHHRTSFSEFIVTHQSSTIERRRLSEIREINEIVQRIMIFVICVNSEIHQIRRYSEFTQSGHNNLAIPSEINRKIHTPFSIDDFPHLINSEIHRGDELRNITFYTMG